MKLQLVLQPGLEQHTLVCSDLNELLNHHLPQSAPNCGFVLIDVGLIGMVEAAIEFCFSVEVNLVTVKGV